MSRAALFLVILAISASAHAQVNKCIGANGRVTYTQDPCPPNTTSGTIERAASPGPAPAPAPASGASTNSAGPRTTAQQEQDFRKRLQDQAKAEKTAAQKADQDQQKKDACQEARERLATFEAGGRITRLSPTGERYFLDDDQIEQERESARQLVKRQCN